jgi:hypothetical protein
MNQVIELCKQYGIGPADLLHKVGIYHDRYNNGGWPEVMELIQDEDPEYLIELITRSDHERTL